MAIDSKSKSEIPFIGLLAVKNNLVTKEELQKGMSQCSGASDKGLALKEHFLSNKMISSENMQRLLRAAKAFEMRQKEFKFGAIAIWKGSINQSVLNLALEEQGNDIKNKKKVRLIGDILVDAGIMTPKQIDYVFKLQKRVRQKNKKEFLLQKSESLVEESKNSGKTLENQANDISAENVPDSEGKQVGLLKPEIIEGGIKLEISKDFMAAFLSKTDEFDENMTLAGLKEALLDKGIVTGLVADDMIEGFIDSSGFMTKTFRVAKGIPPVQGKDATMEFFFNTDYLKVGGLTKDGGIDFKDRGEIPNVEEGTVLAEKIPMVASRNGHNIYGDETETIPKEDIVLKIGKGAKLSEDGIKVLADVKGFPKCTLSGHIFVHQEYITEGDVDYETGHINYDGNVTVKGRIKSGFKVKGNDITAIELDGGSITADGNVKIDGGVNEGKIYARGNVYAKFIHQSQVVCMGDVIIGKEIVDADVECSGICVVENGKFISSRITAKMGVNVRNIGTPMAEPNIVKVGHDPFTGKELEKIKGKVAGIKKQIAQCQNKKEKLKKENLNFQKQITELAHVQDRSQLEVKQINSDISLMQTGSENAEKINILKEKMDQLEIKLQKTEKNLDTCFGKSKNIEELMGKIDGEIKVLETESKNLFQEKTNLISWAKSNPGKPVVTVDGEILSGTLIIGKHCEKRVTEVIRHARIVEALCTSEDGQSRNIYEMRVESL